MAVQSEKIKEVTLKAFDSKARYAVSAVIMMVAGYFGWIAPSETDTGRQCSDLRAQVTAMTTDLYNKGTLGSDSCLLCQTEIRNPSDFDSLQKYGDLKNARDRVCGINKNDYWEPKAEIPRYLAALGLFGILIPRRSSRRNH